MACPDPEADSRLLSFYDQKVRDGVEQLERLESAGDGTSPAAKRLPHRTDEFRQKAARLRDPRRGLP